MLVALTGGIGSGKSTVAARWVELGATEIDADILAREVVEPGSEGLAQVAAEFGTDLIRSEGTLDRQLLATRAFASPERRRKLEAILHPLIQERAKALTSSIEGLIVYTIPLLVETQSPLQFDRVVTVSCPEAVRVDRLVTLRGLSPEEAMARIRSQATDPERERVSDTVIDSDCTLDELLAKADEVFASFEAQ
ncbi:MAG: dephospho-CoA kinase [Aquiluna sp.]